MERERFGGASIWQFVVSVYPSVLLCLSPMACSGGNNRWASLPPQSVIEGQVDVSSFSSPATALIAQDENGTSSAAPLDAAGAFTLSVPSGHVYKLSVSLQQGSALVIFPKSNRIDDAFALDSDGAQIPLGTIRPLAAVPISIVSSPAGCSNGVSAEGGACSIVTETVDCDEGYTSEPASCDNVEVVLTYGTVANAVAATPLGTTFALPAVQPPCEVLGCDLPEPGNPPQGTIAD
jgi:hypothetical protein